MCVWAGPRVVYSLTHSRTKRTIKNGRRWVTLAETIAVTLPPCPAPSFFCSFFFVSQRRPSHLEVCRFRQRRRQGVRTDCLVHTIVYLSALQGVPHGWGNCYSFFLVCVCVCVCVCVFEEKGSLPKRKRNNARVRVQDTAGCVGINTSARGRRWCSDLMDRVVETAAVEGWPSMPI